MGFFPVTRPRRLRRTEVLREHIAETRLHMSDLMYPVFVVHGENIKREITAMPNQYHWSLDLLPELIDEIKKAGVLSIMLFGIPACKDKYASENYADDGIVQQAIAKIKALHPQLIIATDVCLCAYTEDGHCGIVHNNEINNDQTLEILQKTAVSHAKAGADIVSPSGMMDGMIQAMRYALDQEDYAEVAIMSYAVKYASSFYGPFRSACDSTPKGDRKSYQMDYRNKKEALKEAQMDEDEGADFLMIKPALSYLDIIQDVKDNSTLPIAAYHVSGEYAMIKAAAEKGWIDEKGVTLESLTAIKRAGAKIILSYSALDVAKWL
ncbi:MULTISPECIES: porphobilinogen synthase [Cysteiniphilum]|uniref:Delta-aminolevulinic acid dehydratase n=1 Tax=Cysteiniphilum litorale TaxID=2056700 RepID=A0A8J2Z2Z0_9GAMM|nr:MULTISPECIES: porphobilinogen synthase [Cysteiniphilum]GGF90502.1 delta-aminolevulinic acid dehydratase [Cysteiniphilum litorale]